MKKIKQLFILFICALFLCGNVKENISMSFSKNKKLDLKYEILLSEDIDKTQLDSKIKSIEKKGFSITPKTEEGYSGYTVSKRYKSVDEISNGNGDNVNLSDFIFESDNINVSNTFKVKKGFIKNTYIVNYTFENDFTKKTTNDEMVINDENIIPEVQIVDSDNEVVTTELSDENQVSDDVNDGIGDNLISEMKFKYEVKLPYEVINNNASEVSKDKKTLTWNLSSNGISNISYTFPIYNLTNIIILGVGIIVFIIILIIVIKILLNKKHNNEDSLIHTDYDESIEEQVSAFGTKSDVHQSVNNSNSLVKEDPDLMTQMNELQVQTPVMSNVTSDQNQVLQPNQFITPQAISQSEIEQTSQNN